MTSNGRSIIENQSGSSFLLHRTTTEFKNIPINNTDVGFYINLSADVDKKVDLTCMFPALYSSKTFFSSACGKFFQYQCKEPTCKEFPEQATTAEYPSFSAKGHEISSSVYLTKQDWSLNVNALYATECSGTDGEYGDGMYGMVGMGIDGDSYKNFANKGLTFSIYLDEDVEKGELMFSKDKKRALSADPVASLPANNNWHVKGINMLEVGKKKIEVKETSLIFDINSQAIGFPVSMYKEILEAISTNVQGAVLTCPKEEEKETNSFNYRPTCEFTGNVTAVPTISVSIGNQNFDLPSKIYVQYIKNVSESKGSIQFNIRALSSELTDVKNYVTPSYDNYIILDSYTLSYYYTVFEGSDREHNANKIHLYVANHHPSDGSSYVAIWLILAALAAGAIIYLGHYFKKPDTKYAGASEEGQDPLLTPDHPSSNQ